MICTGDMCSVLCKVICLCSPKLIALHWYVHGHPVYPLCAYVRAYRLLDGTKHVQRDGPGNAAEPVVGVPTAKEGPDETTEEEEPQGVQWRVLLPDSVTSLSDIINSIVLYLEELTKFLREGDTAVSLEVKAVREP